MQELTVSVDRRTLRTGTHHPYPPRLRPSPTATPRPTASRQRRNTRPTLHSTPAPIGNNKPKLGVNICDSCGRPPAIVGTFSTDDTTRGLCRVCAHDLKRYDVLEDELVDVMRAWYAASLERGFRPREIEDVMEAVAERLAEESRDQHPHQTREVKA